MLHADRNRNDGLGELLKESYGFNEIILIKEIMWRDCRF